MKAVDWKDLPLLRPRLGDLASEVTCDDDPNWKKFPEVGTSRVVCRVTDFWSAGWRGIEALS